MQPRELHGFGMSGLADNLVATGLSVHLFRYYTEVVSVPPLWVSIVLMLVFTWNAYFDLQMGRISDATRWAWGRRRPYILLGAIPLALAYVFLFSPPLNASPFLRTLHLFVCLLVLFTAKTVVHVPILSMIPERTRNPDERALLASSREKMGNFGDLGGLLLPTLLLIVSAAPGQDEAQGLARAHAYRIAAFIVALLASFALLITYRSTTEARVAPSPSRSLAEYVSLFRNFAPLRALVLASFLGAFALAYVQGMLFYVLEDVMLENDPRVHLAAFLVNIISAVLSYSLWLRAAKLWGRVRTFRGALLLSIGTFFSVYFVLPQAYGALAATMAISGAASVGFWTLLHTLNADLVDLDAERTGIRREGAFAGLTTLVKKLAIAASSAGIGVGLMLIGHQAGQPQTENRPGALSLLFALPPTCAMLFAWWYAREFPVLDHNSKRPERVSRISTRTSARVGGMK